MTLLAHIRKAAMIATGVALGALAYAPAAQAFGFHGGGGHFGGAGIHAGGLAGFHGGGFHGGGFHGGGFHGGGFGGGYGGWGGWGGWGYPYVLGGAYAPYYDYYDDDGGNCTFRRVHVHTIHGWRWRTYEYC